MLAYDSGEQPVPPRLIVKSIRCTMVAGPVEVDTVWYRGDTAVPVVFKPLTDKHMMMMMMMMVS